MGKTRTKVAVIGASGIGKHHAKWWALEGAEVCAFAGTSEASVARTRQVLAEMFGFDGRGYADVGDMLRRERPDVVDVCSPPACHFEHVQAALAAGCDVLCEKPFVYDAELSPDSLLTQARTLAASAQSAGRRLGMCSQYHAAVRCCRELLAEHTGAQTVERCCGRLSSPAKGDAPDLDATWLDLAPHMLAAVQALAPDGAIESDSLRKSFAGWQAAASFRVSAPGGVGMDCEIVTGRTLPGSGASHVREFELNGVRFVIGGGKDAQGAYCAQILAPWGTFERPDALRQTIREFLCGETQLPAPAAVTNLSWLLEIQRRPRE